MTLAIYPVVDSELDAGQLERRKAPPNKYNMIQREKRSVCLR